MSRKAARKRELIEPRDGDKRYIRRDAKGRIKKEVDVADRWRQIDVVILRRWSSRPGRSRGSGTEGQVSEAEICPQFILGKTHRLQAGTWGVAVGLSMAAAARRAS